MISRRARTITTTPTGGSHESGRNALLLGRKTDEGFAGAWASMSDDVGSADRMNSMPKYVVSSTLDKAGDRLFADGIDESTLTLTDTKAFGSGIVILEYEPAQ